MTEHPEQAAAKVRQETRCACHAASAYDCWRSRYAMGAASKSDIEWDGGPCDCPCHDRFTCDDGGEDWL